MNIEDILTVKAELETKLGDYVNYFFTHKDIPLETRWAAYEKLNMLLPIGSDYVDNAIEATLGREVSLYDDFGIEKYQTVKYVDQVEWMEDDLAYAEAQFDTTYAVPQETYEGRMSRDQINTFKEHILASGKQGFIFDW